MGQCPAPFGTLTNRYRRLTRNLEQSPQAAEDAVEIANFHRVLRAHSRDQDFRKDFRAY